jgi:coenzyme F420-reducing hydrogenase beta subunit
LSDIFIQIKQKLISGEKVAFIGTPCQVEGLKKFLQEKYNNLFCIDFVCHGVPSPLIWNKYKEEMEMRYKSHIIGAKFRNKTYGYHSSTMSLMFSNGKNYNASGRIDPMLKAFFEELISRPSCHKCKFKSDKHVSDLTLFDCKNYNYVTGKKDDDLGYTAVLIQSEKGYDILNQATIFLDIKKAEVEKLIEADGIMVRNSAIPNKQRELFWENIRNKKIIESLETVCKIGIKDVILEKTKVVLYKTGLLKLLHKLKK